MKLPDGPGVSQRDRIIAAIEQRPHMTELEIAKAVFSNAYQQRVNQTCRLLADAKLVVRHGKGGPGDPFRYTIRKSDA